MKKTKKIVKKNNEKEQADGTILLKGAKALLLAEACKLNKTKKAAEKRIKNIKIEIGLTKTGEYVNDANDKLVLSESDKFTEIEPKKLFDKFKKKNMTPKFFGVVKVQLKELEKIMPKSIIQTMRSPLDPTSKWSFK